MPPFLPLCVAFARLPRTPHYGCDMHYFHLSLCCGVSPLAPHADVSPRHLSLSLHGHCFSRITLTKCSVPLSSLYLSLCLWTHTKRLFFTARTASLARALSLHYHARVCHRVTRVLSPHTISSHSESDGATNVAGGCTTRTSLLALHARYHARTAYATPPAAHCHTLAGRSGSTFSALTLGTLVCTPPCHRFSLSRTHLSSRSLPRTADGGTWA